MTVNAGALDSAQPIGWADAPITRYAAGRVGMPAIRLNQGTITTDVPAVSSVVTWNNAAITFTADRVNVTDTASNANSLLLDRQVGSVSKFSVKKDGTVNAANAVIAAGYVSSASSISVLNNGGYFGLGVSLDARIFREAAGIFGFRNGTNAQESRLYGTYTDASNYRRATLKMSTAGVAELKPEGAGTGASGNVLHISGFPTSNPGPGIFWNNAGTPAIGT